MSDRAVFPRCRTEYPEGPSSDLRIHVAEDDVTTDGGLRSQPTLATTGVRTWRIRVMQSLLHRRKPATPVACDPSQQQIIQRNAQIAARLPGVAIAVSNAQELPRPRFDAIVAKPDTTDLLVDFHCRRFTEVT